MMMEALANKIAVYLGKSLNKDDEEIAVIRYGLIALLQTCSIFIIALIIGALFNFIPEAMTAFFSVGFIRRFIGGHHSQKLYSCLAVSVCCISLFSALTRYLIVPFVPLPVIGIFVCLVYISAFWLTYKLAPVDNPNKRIRTEDKRKRLRRNSFIVLSVFFVLSISSLIFQSLYSGVYSRITVSLAVSVLWQVLMLTSAGKFLISNIDYWFK